ncbi:MULTISPECIES: transporter substrate-binding protein [unclassified Lentilitoribacter]|uniref:transporter substrate-binding protein n=1 Tax=unclassified Lentilitoribacter TaxID=2647570 RepID=UPI0013A6A557|nr:transporter substrate-binding protein [Lentilitoribacter sp. Alg239-R112]
MGKRIIEIGLLFSRSGDYRLISESCRTGALNAIARVNEDQTFDFKFHAVERDPKSDIDKYEPLCAEILKDSTARHIIGCVTSSSRKEVIPTLERSGGTLWYTVPYEGFEASDHVVYTHSCPNQHLLPLLDWAFSTYGKRGYLTGSNYIWGWEMNRIAREEIEAAGGEVLGERYLPIGSPNVDLMMDEIIKLRPSFIMNSLIGESQYKFISAYYDLGKKDAHFLPDTCPIMSCNLTECELPALGDTSEGLISAGPYFKGQSDWPHGNEFSSSHEAGTFAAVMELARLLSLDESADQMSLAKLLAQDDADQGIIDPKTHHTKLPVLIAQVENGTFVTRRQFAPVMGDPYLSRGRKELQIVGPDLRIVS